MPKPAAQSVSQPQPTATLSATAPHAPLPALTATLTQAPRPDFAQLDRTLHLLQGQFTAGASPLALTLALNDWFLHQTNAPFRQMELAFEAATDFARLGASAISGPAITPERDDHRFAHPLWQNEPYQFWQQAFLIADDWMKKAIAGPAGIDAQNQRLLSFAARQWMDMLAPSNIPWMNPEIIHATLTASGENLKTGFANALNDLSGKPPANDHAVGCDLAVTPGKVVFRDHLIELIQYAPATGTVRPEPLLIVPAWIMKYYILDLSQENSLIRYLVNAGHTVFCISWRNPDASYRDVGFDDYRQSLMAAIGAVSEITGAPKIHAAGYCLGGTLLSVAAAAMARDGDDRLASMTLFAAQTDFTEAGELQIFVTDDQLAFLEDVMASQGYLDGKQMGGAFQLLKSRDLIWSKLIRSYWLGETEHPSDLMAWNADTTRMPARMHSDYLRRLFLNDDLAEGRFRAAGRPVALADIRVPIFIVGTETDHVAPWRSVYKLTLLNAGEITFALTSGGHNAGIVSEPGHPHRHFRIHTRAHDGGYIDPDRWLEIAPLHEGSWWPVWQAWLDRHSGAPQKPPNMGSRTFPPLVDAPGTYVLET
jgi:polyhydroxyalkanoate synthase